MTFALIGLFLYLEKGYSGKQVQLAHMQIAKNKKAWTMLDLPEGRGDITVFDVLKAAPGQSRDLLIKSWCVSVWDAYKAWHQGITQLTKIELDVA